MSLCTVVLIADVDIVDQFRIEPQQPLGQRVVN